MGTRSNALSHTTPAERDVAIFAAGLVASVQRRTSSRAEAYRVACSRIEQHCFDAVLEHRVRLAVYCRLFPEYAHRLGAGEVLHA
jgi:hypothetical protein